MPLSFAFDNVVAETSRFNSVFRDHFINSHNLLVLIVYQCCWEKIDALGTYRVKKQFSTLQWLVKVMLHGTILNDYL